MTRLALIIGAALALAQGPAAAQAPAPAASAQAGPAAAVSAFLDAFNALDRTRFDPMFADDATLFFPGGPFEVRRVEGKAEVLKWFGRFFDMARERTARLNIVAQDVHVQDYGTTAVATFHLAGNEMVGRRTLVLRKSGNARQIVHMHASAQPVKKG